MIRQNAVGLDVGTRTSRAARCGQRGTEVVPTPEGGRSIPSAVYVGHRGEVAAGMPAVLRGALRPDDLYTGFKPRLGTAGSARDLRGWQVTPTVLTAALIRRLVTNVERDQGGAVREAVIAVPAHYGDAERGCVLDAARIAGIDTPHLVNDTAAAALACAMDASRGTRGQRVLVVSMGESSFAAAVVAFSRRSVRVLGSAADPRLGGRDFDEILANLIAEHAYERSGADPREHSGALLDERARQAKHALSTSDETTVELPGTGALRVARSSFESRAAHVLERVALHLERVAERAQIAWPELDLVILAGGATRMPMIADLVRRTVARPFAALDPEEAVARGAAVAAAYFSGQLSLEAELDDRPVDSGPRRSGTSSRTRRALGAEPAYDEASAIAALLVDESEELAGYLPGAVGDAPILDLVTHGLGVVVATAKGPRNSVLIPSQTPIPAERSKEFVTIKADQKAVLVKVLEGEAKEIESCRVIGTLRVDGLPRNRPAGAKIEVVYRYDSDGRVQVLARDVATGKAAKATISRGEALGDGEVRELRAMLAGAFVT